ncbi:hypothetical protein FACS1894103_1650 [Campylobacterota bacterium]|nr:hypothetical protein FACS1894103_1650 [Campylobacterota bacterium]
MIRNFEFIAELIFNGDETKAYELCEKCGGLTFTIPVKQHKRAFAERLLRQGVSVLEISKKLDMQEQTLRKIKARAKL